MEDAVESLSLDFPMENERFAFLAPVEFAR
jgi:hypothetical protein